MLNLDVRNLSLVMGSAETEIADFANSVALFAQDCANRVTEPAVRQAIVARLVDTVGCLRGAMNEDAVVRARKTALTFSLVATSAKGASVAGTAERVTVEAATFVNCVAARYLDFNDIYLSKEAVHPSDNIPAALALAETLGVSGAELVDAMAVGYEVHCRLADAVSTRKGRWDNVILGAIAASVMAGKLLKLGRVEMVHAINIAASGNTALMQTRVGTLSMWKAAAAAYAARAGVFAAISAAEGLTGPPAALNGSHGLFMQVTGLPEEGAFDIPVGSFHLLNTHLKAYSSQYFTQTAISAALALRPRVPVNKIRKIVVSTFEFGRVAAADSAEKWRPRTRETADHSMPFCVAIALLDGAVTVSSFDAHNLERPDLVALLGRIEVVEDPAFTAIYPSKVPTGIQVELSDGRVEAVVIDFPLGHSGNPMSNAQIAEKFLDVSGSTAQMQALLIDLGGIERLEGAATTALIRRAVNA